MQKFVNYLSVCLTFGFSLNYYLDFVMHTQISAHYFPDIITKSNWNYFRQKFVKCSKISPMLQFQTCILTPNTDWIFLSVGIQHFFFKYKHTWQKCDNRLNSRYLLTIQNCKLVELYPTQSQILRFNTSSTLKKNKTFHRAEMFYCFLNRVMTCQSISAMITLIILIWKIAQVKSQMETCFVSQAVIWSV